MSEHNPHVFPGSPEVENPQVEKLENPSDNSDNSNTPESSNTSDSLYTVAAYLQGISPLLSEDALRVVLAKRKLRADTPVDTLDERTLDLAEAEVYYSLSNLPVGGATTKDVDGSWSHTEGGWTVSGENIREWYRKYVSLREKWGEKILAKSTIRVHSRGIRVWRRR